MADPQTYRKMDKPVIILVLDNIRSAINVGSIFRSADAFGVEKIYPCGITAVPPNKDILKSALGATDSVSWEYSPSTVELIGHFKELKYQIICIEQTDTSVSLNDFVPDPAGSYVLVLGNEVHGVSPEILALAHTCLEIPQVGIKRSLNVAVAAGIALWEFAAKASALAKI